MACLLELLGIDGFWEPYDCAGGLVMGGDQALMVGFSGNL